MKHIDKAIIVKRQRMPPTRGHDLKRSRFLFFLLNWMDAPHTGARLETYRHHPGKADRNRMPPTRGHDLKLFHIFDILKR